MSVSISGFSSTPSLTVSAASTFAGGSLASRGSVAASAKSAAQQFQEYASMTPAQRLHAEMLGQLGLTEDQFKALPPAEQQKINEKIQQMIQQQMGDKNDTPTGLVTDKTA